MVSMNLPFSLFRYSLISIFCSPWGRKESDITDQLNWTELISIFPSWEKLFARTRGTWFQYFKNIFKRGSIYHLKLAYILAWKFLCWGCGGYFSYFQSKDGIERWTVQQIPHAKWAWIDLFRAGFLNLRTVVICCCSVTKSYPTLRPQGLQHASSLSFTISLSLLKHTSIESVILYNHLILCCLLLLLPSIFPSIRVFSNVSVLHIRWPKYWCFSFIWGQTMFCWREISCAL